MRLRFVTALTALFVCVPSLSAQQVRLRGYGDADLDDRIRATLGARPLIITRDTTIRAGDTLRANVLVLKSRFILEGTVRGDLMGVEANMYLRPGARVTGEVVNIAGGYYASELAKIGSLDDRSLAPYQLVIEGSTYIIKGNQKRPALQMLGGMRPPEYNRVDGLHVEVGPRILLPPLGPIEPAITASIGYATERKEVLGRAELRLKRGRSSLAAGWEDDVTSTNEDWIRSALNNSLSVIWNGKDYRNYYEADRTYVEFRRILERGARTSAYWIRGQNEAASELVAGDPFIVWKPDSIRSNPIVASSRIASLIVGAETELTGTTTVWQATGAVELAGRALDADAVFNAYTMNVRYATLALADHTLRIEANFRGPLPGTEHLPLQRWTFVGGSGTLYTFRLGQLRGDRLAFIETEYRIPLARRMTLPLLGRPTLRLMHNAGMAWSRNDNPGFEQNVGVRLQFAVAYVRVVTNPKDVGGDAKLGLGVSLPGKTYPWEKKKK